MSPNDTAAQASGEPQDKDAAQDDALVDLNRPPLSETEARLHQLTMQIQQKHSRYKKHAQACAEQALEIGYLLVETKRLVPHGQWRHYIATNFDFCERTAQDYMRAARSRLKSATLADIGLQGAAVSTDRYLRQKFGHLSSLDCRNPKWPNGNYRPKGRDGRARPRAAGKGLNTRQARTKLPFRFRRPRQDEVLQVTWEIDDTLKCVYIWHHRSGKPDRFHRVHIQLSTSIDDTFFGGEWAADDEYVSWNFAHGRLVASVDHDKAKPKVHIFHDADVVQLVHMLRGIALISNTDVAAARRVLVRSQPKVDNDA